MSEPLRFESLGGGQQSSALLLMSAAGVLPRLDGVIFADTQGEAPETYAHLLYLREQADNAGIPFYIVSAGSLYDDIISRQGKGMQPTPPVHLITTDPKTGEPQKGRASRYTCSYDYKRRPVTAQVKRLCGPRGTWKRSNVEQWIGYSADESSRIKQPDECRCGVKRTRTIGKGKQREVVLTHPTEKCERFDAWQVNRFPLVEMNMRRGDVQRWLVENGHPVPPRSACWFCPNRGNAHWRTIRAQRADLWDQAIVLDEVVRGGLNHMDGIGFLHGSRTPLATADLRTDGQRKSDQGQDGLFDEEAVLMDCELGVCHT